MADILLQKLSDKLGQRISNLEQSRDIVEGNIQDMNAKLSDLEKSVGSIEKFNDNIQTLVNNTLVSTNNTIDGVETAITVFGVAIVIGGFILQSVIRKKTKSETEDLGGKLIKSIAL